jgi:hypothetical protein
MRFNRLRRRDFISLLGEVKVIGDEPANTDYDPDPSEKAASSGEATAPQGRASVRPLAARNVFLRK